MTTHPAIIAFRSLIIALDDDPTQSAHAATIRDDIRNEHDFAQLLRDPAFDNELTELILFNEIDPIDAIDALHALCPDTPEFTAFAQSFEICPMHRCDEQICADDEITECAHLR